MLETATVHSCLGIYLTCRWRNNDEKLLPKYLGGWCSEEIPQCFSRKWSLARNEISSNHAKEEIPEANHSKNQDTEPPSLSLQGKPSELLLINPTNYETIHTGIIHCGHSNQVQKEAFTSYTKAVGMGCLAFSKSVLHRKRQ